MHRRTRLGRGRLGPFGEIDDADEQRARSISSEAVGTPGCPLAALHGDGEGSLTDERNEELKHAALGSRAHREQVLSSADRDGGCERDHDQRQGSQNSSNDTEPPWMRQGDRSDAEEYGRHADSHGSIEQQDREHDAI